jgi:lycopene beta-cyclase
MPSYDYDYIIAGGGCAGLSLAYYLHHSPLREARILVLDEAPKTRNDKTWCFWWDQSLPYACARETSWRKVEIASPHFQRTEDIDPMAYVFIRSLDFYEEVRSALADNPNITFRYERVMAVEDLPEGARVSTTEGSYTAKWAFNSIVFPQRRRPNRHLYLEQHFAGWFVRSQQPVFDPTCMRMMDFRVEQGGEVRFVYILPFSETEALVEFTVFSEQTWEMPAYEAGLRDFLTNQLALEDYDITHREQGRIPMTDHPLQRQPGRHVRNLGTAAGLTKPTTGYTFLNIQRDAQAIVAALVKTGSPVYQPVKRRRFAFYDSLLLWLIRNQGGQVSQIFEQLFRKNSFQTILRFLDERTSLREELPMLAGLPWGPFFRAIWRYLICRDTGRPQPAPSLPSDPAVPKPQPIAHP